MTNHAISRILDPRTRALGFNTPNDVVQVMNNGIITTSRDGAIEILYRGLSIAVDPRTNRVTTIQPE